MSSTIRTRLTAAICGIAGCLIAAPAASAGTINYTVDPSPAFAIQDNGNGIVKVTYNGCVTAGERQTLSFTIATIVGADANATFKVLKAEGGDPTTTFTPPTVFLQRGERQTIAASLAYTLDQANNGVTTFRIKLDPESGEGLGEGAGVMVRIPCVLAAPPAAGPGPEQQQTSGTSQGGAATILAAPTAGVFPSVMGAQAKSPAPCVAVPKRLRLRRGEVTTVRVVVSTNGQTIQGSLVRATYPGARQIKRSDAQGVVTFRIKPRKSGRVVLQSDVCFGADRVSVLGARAVGGSRVGRFTG